MRAFGILPMVTLEISPMVPLVANGTIGNQRTLNDSRLPMVPLVPVVVPLVPMVPLVGTLVPMVPSVVPMVPLVSPTVIIINTSYLFFSSPEPTAHRWAYRIPMVRRPSVVRPSVVRPSSVVNNFKLLLLWNRLANQNQILCGASLGRGNESLFAASESHNQDGRHAHIW